MAVILLERVQRPALFIYNDGALLTCSGYGRHAIQWATTLRSVQFTIFRFLTHEHITILLTYSCVVYRAWCTDGDNTPESEGLEILSVALLKELTRSWR